MAFKISSANSSDSFERPDTESNRLLITHTFILV